MIPTPVPTVGPTPFPSPLPTELPSPSPTGLPTKPPSPSPSVTPSEVPTAEPSVLPTGVPTPLPSPAPSDAPTGSPSLPPTPSPSSMPSFKPTTETPTPLPSSLPTMSPSSLPTTVPSHMPTASPTYYPSQLPTTAPSHLPTNVPTSAPTQVPSEAPTIQPTEVPSPGPTEVPTGSPTYPPTPPPSATDEVAVSVKLVLKAESGRHVNQKVVFKGVSNSVRGCKIRNMVYFEQEFSKKKKRAIVQFDVRMELDKTRFPDAHALQYDMKKRFKRAIADGSLTTALQADCDCEIDAVSVETSLARQYPTLSPTLPPTSIWPSPAPTSLPSMVPTHMPTAPTMQPSPYCYEPCPASVKVLIDYVEETVGEVVTWLHTKDQYLEALMDVLYGSTDEPGANDDDEYRGYNTFGNDDGQIGGYNGPQSNSGMQNKGAADDDDKTAHSAGPKSKSDLVRKAAQSKAKLGGVTKLAAELYSIPTLKTGEAYARASVSSSSSTTDSQLPTSRRANVVAASDLSDAYYEALTELTKSSVHYESFVATPSKKQQDTEASKHSQFGVTEDAALHPALTAAATVVAFAVGLVATKTLS